MKKTDPRVTRTRKKLREAFLTIIVYQPLNEISVKDITRLADITRGTFYQHYQDRETYLHLMMEESLTEYFDYIMFNRGDEGEEPMYACSLLKIFEYVEQKPDFFLMLLKQEEAIEYRIELKEQFHNYLHVFVKNNRKKNGKPKKRAAEKLLVDFFTYAFLGFVNTWIEDDMIYGKRYMARNLYKLLNSQFLQETGLIEFFAIDQ